VRRAEDWAWSSAAAHVRGGDDGVAESAWLAERTAGWVCTWGEYLREEEDGAFAASMRRHERTGRPLGEKPFVRKLERLLGRVLLPKKPARPRKAEK
jgi:putative transposase